MFKKYLGPLNNFKNMYIFLYPNRKSLFKEFKWVWTQMRFRPETLTCEIRERLTLASRPALPSFPQRAERVVSRKAWAAARREVCVPSWCRPSLCPGPGRPVAPALVWASRYLPTFHGPFLLISSSPPRSGCPSPGPWHLLSTGVSLCLSLLAPSRGVCHCL